MLTTTIKTATTTTCALLLFIAHKFVSVHWLVKPHCATNWQQLSWQQLATVCAVGSSWQHIFTFAMCKWFVWLDNADKFTKTHTHTQMCSNCQFLFKAVDQIACATCWLQLARGSTPGHHFGNPLTSDSVHRGVCVISCHLGAVPHVEPINNLRQLIR